MDIYVFHTAYTFKKGGVFLAYLWILTIGFVICLGMAGGIFIYALRSSLDTEDSTRIDSKNLPK
jgi:uncharacterized protein YneF (UPF0154 family)